MHKCLCIAYGTGKADVIGEPHNSKAHSLSRKAFLYEMRFGVVSYNITEGS